MGFFLKSSSHGKILSLFKILFFHTKYRKIRFYINPQSIACILSIAVPKKYKLEWNHVRIEHYKAIKLVLMQLHILTFIFSQMNENYSRNNIFYLAILSKMTQFSTAEALGKLIRPFFPSWGQNNHGLA